MKKDKLDDYKEKLEILTTTYDEVIEEDFNRIDIQDRVLSDCLKDQISLTLTWFELTREVSFMVSELEVEVERIFSIAFKELSVDSSKALTYNEAKIYAQSDEDYVKTKRVFNAAKILKAKCEAINDAIKSRQFILKNICDVLRDGNDGHII